MPAIVIPAEHKKFIIIDGNSILVSVVVAELIRQSQFVEAIPLPDNEWQIACRKETDLHTIVKIINSQICIIGEEQ